MFDNKEWEIDVSPEGEVLDLIVDDDSGDDALLAVGYVMAIGSPLVAIVVGSVVYKRSKAAEGHANLDDVTL